MISDIKYFVAHVFRISNTYLGAQAMLREDVRWAITELGNRKQQLMNFLSCIFNISTCRNITFNSQAILRYTAVGLDFKVDILPLNCALWHPHDMLCISILPGEKQIRAFRAPKELIIGP